jgi:hypothetical protein
MEGEEGGECGGKRVTTTAATFFYGGSQCAKTSGKDSKTVNRKHGASAPIAIFPSYGGVKNAFTVYIHIYRLLDFMYGIRELSESNVYARTPGLQGRSCIDPTPFSWQARPLQPRLRVSLCPCLPAPPRRAAAWPLQGSQDVGEALAGMSRGSWLRDAARHSFFESLRAVSPAGVLNFDAFASCIDLCCIDFRVRTIFTLCPWALSSCALARNMSCRQKFNKR